MNLLMSTQFPIEVTTTEIANLIINSKLCDATNPKFSGSEEVKYEARHGGGESFTVLLV